ncbi:MAG: hypothetical protein QW429_00475 [Thermoprotei archaeon]
MIDPLTKVRRIKFKGRRSLHAILYEVLVCVDTVSQRKQDGWAPYTSVLTISMSNAFTGRKYLDYAEQNGWVERNGTRYRLTSKGREAMTLLKGYVTLENKLVALGEAIHNLSSKKQG